MTTKVTCQESQVVPEGYIELTDEDIGKLYIHRFSSDIYLLAKISVNMLRFLMLVNVGSGNLYSVTSASTMRLLARYIREFRGTVTLTTT